MESKLSRAFQYLFLTVIAFLCAYPFYWMIASATNPVADIITGKTTPGTYLFENFRALTEKVDLIQVFWNSIKIAVVGVIITILISSMAGYAFQIFQSRPKERVYRGILLTMMTPFAAIMIPLFVMVANLGLMNTTLGVVLPLLASGFVIFYFRQASKAFPTELRDAARVDGLPEWRIFLFVYVPVMKSTYAAAFIIIFMMHWNNYLWPLITLQSNDSYTIVLTLSGLAGEYNADYGMIMVASILASLPVVLIFFLMQRQFVEGMTGSVK